MNGLLGELKRYIQDASPGGLLNPELSRPVVKGILGFTPVVGDAISAMDAYDAASKGNYGEAAINAIGVLPAVPAIAGPLSSAGKKIAEQALEMAKRGERARPQVIGDLTPTQFDALNKQRIQQGLPPFSKNEVLYNGTHHYSSRNADRQSIPEMLTQIERSLAPESIMVTHPRGPALQNPVSRIDELGDLVKDRAVLEGGGSRPMFLFSAYGKKQK